MKIYNFQYIGPGNPVLCYRSFLYSGKSHWRDCRRVVVDFAARATTTKTCMFSSITIDLKY